MRIMKNEQGGYDALGQSLKQIFLQIPSTWGHP